MKEVLIKILFELRMIKNLLRIIASNTERDAVEQINEAFSEVHRGIS